MKIKKETKKSSAFIPTSSFADVAFLLLVFFMLTTVIAITKGVFQKLPTEQSEGKDKTPSIYLHASADGGFMIDGKPASFEEIFPYCRNKLIINPNKPVIVHCAGNRNYQSFIRIMDELKQLNEQLYGEYNKGVHFTEQKFVKIVIPALKEADAMLAAMTQQ